MRKEAERARAFRRPDNLPDALAAMAEGGWTVLGGGTDLYPATTAPALGGRVLDLTAIDSLVGIAERPEGGLRIGAMTRWREIARAGLPPACDALRVAAGMVGGRQIQASGTIGGNLCNASPAADGVPPLLVLDAEIVLASAEGERRLPLSEFLQGPRRTARREDEILAEILLPAEALAGATAFEKLGARAHLVISIAMIAARIVVAEGRIAQAALAIGACSPVAIRLPALEQRLIGLAPEADLIAAALPDAEIAGALAPIDDPRADAAYRRRAAAELLRRATVAAAERAA